MCLRSQAYVYDSGFISLLLGREHAMEVKFCSCFCPPLDEDCPTLDRQGGCVLLNKPCTILLSIVGAPSPLEITKQLKESKQDCVKYCQKAGLILLICPGRNMQAMLEFSGHLLLLALTYIEILLSQIGKHLSRTLR